ncbi:transposase family protein [Streptomyces vinaceus]
MCRQPATVCLVKSPSRRQRELPDVNVRLCALPDPRDRRRRRHALASVLLTAACAVLAGARSYVAIGQWARHAPQDTLARLGFYPRASLGVRLPGLGFDCAPGAGRGVAALRISSDRNQPTANRSRWTARVPADHAPIPGSPPTSCQRAPAQTHPKSSLAFRSFRRVARMGVTAGVRVLGAWRWP